MGLQTAALLLSILIGLLLALIVWGFWRLRHPVPGVVRLGSRDDVLLGMMAFAVFALGVFVTYALLGVAH